MEAIKHHPWRISVQAKGKNFNFKLTASKILPSSEFLQETKFSALIKLRRFLLKFRSETGDSVKTRSGSSLKSKFFRLWNKFRSKRVRDSNNNNNNSVSVTTKKSPNRLQSSGNGFWRKIRCEKPALGSLLVGNSDNLLSHRPVSEKDRTGIVIHTFALVYYYLVVVFKNFIWSRKYNYTYVIAVALVAICLIIWFVCLNYSSGQSTQNRFWMGWNRVAAGGYLYLLIAQIVFSSIGQYVRGAKSIWWLISTSVSVSIVLLLVNRYAAMWMSIVAKALRTCITSYS